MRALVDRHDAVTREVTFNERLIAFARYWGFRPRACAPYRARTKGKDERGVGYVKLIFYTWNFQGLDYKCKSALEKRLGTTF